MWRECVLDDGGDRSDVVTGAREHLMSAAQGANALDETAAGLTDRSSIAKRLIRNRIDDGEHVLDPMRELGIDQPGTLLGSDFGGRLDHRVEKAGHVTVVIADRAVAKRKVGLFRKAGAMHDE